MKKETLTHIIASLYLTAAIASLVIGFVYIALAVVMPAIDGLIK